MNEKELADLASRWDGVTKGHTRLTFEEAQADMQALLAEVRKAAELMAKLARTLDELTMLARAFRRICAPAPNRELY